MCGIAGFVGAGDETNLKLMADKIAHRGPDECGTYVDRTQSLYFAHQRLSILDLSGGKQPMKNSDESLIIVFNGEIYNFNELRKVLIGLGYVFKTNNSDTEVLLHGYKEWNKDLPKFLNGMFAFAIYDKSYNEIFIARDRFGEKPFYYYFDERNFAFSSELASLAKYKEVTSLLDDLSLQKYFAYGYIPAPRTIYKNCFKLKPGESMKFNITKRKLSHDKYWEFRLRPDHSIVHENQAIEELDHLIRNSVQMRLLSDVPLGLFLSGGLDSSAILAYVYDIKRDNSIKSFTIAFSEKSFDESRYAKQVAEHFGTLNLQRVMDFDEMKKLSKQILQNLDEPIADPSILPTYFLSKFAKEHVTVALSGDGGDEMFAGYDPFNALEAARFYQKIVPSILHKKLQKLTDLLPTSQNNMSFDFKVKRALLGLSYKESLWNPVWLSPAAPDQIKELFFKPLDAEELYSEVIEVWDRGRNLDLVDKTIEFYTNFYLPGSVLSKVDRATMMNSLESRAVFLDKDLAEFCMRLPNHFKFRNGIKKYILKKLLEKRIPSNILKRKKKGFGIPVAKWLMDFPKEISIEGLENINNEYAKKMWLNHRSGKQDNRMFMWSWFVLQNFLQSTRA